MTKHTVQRMTATIVVGAVALTGVGAAAASAAPVVATTSTTSTISLPLPASLTAGQWRDIARTAAAQGDTPAANAARLAAARSGRDARPQAWSLIAKTAIKAAIKYGQKYLPKKIRPWANKLSRLIDEVEGMAEVGIFVTLVNAGIPPDIARATAQWIVTFL